VPRRVTTRRSARRLPPVPLLAAATIFVLLAATWTLNPFASAARLTSSAPPSTAARDLNAATADGTTVSSDQPAEVALPTPPANAAAQLAPLQRQWDTSRSDGIAPDPVLTRSLDQALAGVDGHMGIVVKDLGSSKGAVLNGNLELQSASLYKLPILFSVFDLGLNMAEELTITDEALSYDAGTMELSAGESLSVAEALERMVTLSDNTSAILLGGRVGAARINANIAALGMDTTHYSLERMTTSALDVSRLLELIADGNAVSNSASADMLHLLLRQRVNDRLPRLLPASVQVAHKTGNLPGVVNDAGILYGSKSTVLVAALVSDTSDEVAAATAIAEVGQIANAYFDGQASSVVDHPTVLPAPLRAIPPVWRESHPPTATPTAVPRAELAVLQATPTVVATTAPPTAVASPTRAATVEPPTAVATAKPTAAPPPPTATRAPQPPTAAPVPPQPARAPPTTAPKPAGATPTLPPSRR
jgi:beta-lactamase class A